MMGWVTRVSRPGKYCIRPVGLWIDAFGLPEVTRQLMGAL